MNKLIETLAAQVYAKMPYDGTGEKPAWVPCGNSNKQDEAHRTVRSVLSAIEAAGMVVVPSETLPNLHGNGVEDDTAALQAMAEGKPYVDDRRK